MTDLDLGVIGNCRFSALVDKQARIVWSCMPRFDSDPVFCSLLSGTEAGADDASGLFEIGIDGLTRSTQDYLSNTAVLRTELEDAQGNLVEVLDLAPRFTRHGRRFRPTAIVRIVRPLRGRPRIRIRLRPRFDYGATAASVTHGSNHIRYVGPRETLRLTGTAPVSYVLGETWFHLEQPIHLYLGPDESLERPVQEFCDECFGETVGYWREWVRMLAIPLDWQDAVIRAAIALKLCWFEDTGAFVAALTTSIPEAQGSGRNWDYRYCWLRDSYYVIRALNRLGVVDIMEGYLGYLRNLISTAGDGPLQPLYGIALEQELEEREAPALAGYRGMGPVRVGNLAFRQRQNDIYGQIVLSAAQAFFDRRLLRPVGPDDFRELEKMGERAWALHATDDAGLWEFRNSSRVHTYSAAMCWAACDRLALIARHLGLGKAARQWRRRANEIHDAVLKGAWNEQAGHFGASFGGEDVDASLLQLADIGFLNASDPRFRSTLAMVEQRLVFGHRVKRYAHEDDFGLPETAFNVCAFWYIEALHAVGSKAKAREHFEAMLAGRNHVGLLSEDSDIATGAMWGNYPQTYSMVGIINAAVLLSRPWSAVR